MRKSIEGKGVESAASLDALVGKLQSPRAMVPAGEAVDKTLDALMPRLTASDAVIDGGNAYYKDTLRRAKMLASMQIHTVDCGASGGVWGLAEGYSMMIAGAAHASNLTYPQPVDAALLQLLRSVKAAA